MHAELLSSLPIPDNQNHLDPGPHSALVIMTKSDIQYYNQLSRLISLLAEHNTIILSQVF
jgi:hypothetical protein